MTIQELNVKVLKYNPQADLTPLEEAYAFAKKAHQGQFRISGEPYIEHPLAVAGILADLQLDVTTLAAGLLHDVVEDTGVSLADLQARFGQEVAQLVDGVTKLSKIELRSHEEEQVQNLRKMLLAIDRDIRVLMIRLADRLHNMRTLKYIPLERQKTTARETLEIFAPLAHRLGIFQIKTELEDLALRYLEPEVYHDLAQKVQKKRTEREAYIGRFIEVLREKLAAAGIEADIQGRAKHFYSLYRKMYVQGRDFGEIYDLIAVRVLVETDQDCYAALGVIHTVWKPIPGRFKDFIAVPKTNMYQSLHTTVIGPEGEPVEIQIRTNEMHRTAEYGIAAHWRYKEGGKADAEFEEKLALLRERLEGQHELTDPREFMEGLKSDLFADEVFVFTPKGDVIELPAGAGPLDFAYQIHTDVGHRCIGAKVNGKIVPLTYKLKNGDIVEILTAKQGAGPSGDWLDMVVTAGAKSKIRQWFKRERREEYVVRGRDLLEKEMERLGLEPPDLMRPEWVKALLQRFGYAGEDDLFAAVGYGGLTPQYAIGKLREEYDKEKRAKPVVDLFELGLPTTAPATKARPTMGIRVTGEDNMLVRFSRCCNPIPGDPIIGYITRGRGVSIHRADCPNVTHYTSDKARLIDVAWDTEQPSAFSVEVEINGIDRPGLMADVLNSIADTRTNILAANARADRNKMGIIDLVLEIRNLEQLRYVIQRIAKVRDVFSVSRVVRDKTK
ncbi:MAG: RelA/SpoT family protein [Bacillota bacterium]